VIRRWLTKAMTQANCCIVGVGCGLALIVSGGALTGAAGYVTYQLLT